MSDTTPTTPEPGHLTVEDAGSTTDPADLVEGGGAPAAAQRDADVPNGTYGDDVAVDESADESAAPTSSVGGGSTAAGPATAVAAGGRGDDAGSRGADLDGTGLAQGDLPDPEGDRAAAVAADATSQEPAVTQETPTVDDGAGAGGGTGLGDLAGDDVGHVFDQTNGVIDGIEGESDGFAGDDDTSAAEREEV